MSNQKFVDGLASFKAKAKKRLDDTLSALLVILWPYREDGFAWGDHTDIETEVNNTLVAMDDALLSDMDDILSDILEDEGLKDYEDEAIMWAAREIEGEDARFRLDRHADHLKDLLALWIGIAATKSMSAAEIKTQILTYGGMPQLSPLWDGPRTPIFDWGKGYQRNLVNAITVIGQDYINGGYQYARIQEFKEDETIIGYRTVRNSTFHCPFCDDMTQHVWPLDEVKLPWHPRCCCVAIPVYEDELAV